MDMRSLPSLIHTQRAVEETHDEALCSHFRCPKALQQTLSAKESSKKEQEGRQEENPEDEAQLVQLIARLTLQHEFERMVTVRAENIASEFEASSETMVAMEASKETYEAEGQKTRKTSGDQYKGHP